MDFNIARTINFTAIAVAGSAIAALFGGWTKDLETLVTLMAVDYIMGLLLAGYFKKSNKTESGALDSRVGWMGLCKKGAGLLVVLVAYRLDVSAGLDFIRSTVIIGFIANEAVSIIENAGLMGVPMPAAMTRAVEVLKAKSDKTDLH